MPPLSQVHVDRPLTDFAIATLADPSDFVVGTISPIVPVDHLTDKYYILPRNPFARGSARPRVPNAESAGFDFYLSTSNYVCQVYAQHVDLPRMVVENADDPRMIEEGATRLCIDNIRLTHERSWANTFFGTGIWSGSPDYIGGTSGAYWDDYANSDPKTAFKIARRNILVNGGRDPNVFAIGYDVFLALQDHPRIKAQFAYTSSDSITAEMLAAYFGIEKLVVLKATYATSNPGQVLAGTETYSFVFGGSALLAYVAPSPGYMIPSAMYTFSWKGTSGGGVMNEDGTAAVMVIDKPLHRALRYEVEMNWADVQTGAYLGAFFSNIVLTQ